LKQRRHPPILRPLKLALALDAPVACRPWS
jgi:hypothetical protein